MNRRDTVVGRYSKDLDNLITSVAVEMKVNKVVASKLIANKLLRFRDDDNKGGFFF